MTKRIAYRLKMIKKLMPYANGVKRLFILNFFLSIISMTLIFATPVVYKFFIDEVILNKRFDRMLIVVEGYLGIFFVNVFLEYIRNYANYTLVHTTLFNVKQKIWKGFYARPFETYESAEIGDMKMRLEDDTAQIEKFAGYQTIEYLISFVSLLVGILLLFAIEWRLALFSMTAIPLTFWVDGILSKKESALIDTNRENDQKFSGWLHNSVLGWKEVKALGIELFQKRKFFRFLHQFALFNAKWINYWTARVLVIPKIKEEFFKQFGLYFLGGLLIIHGDMEISSLLVFAVYYGMLSDALGTVSGTDAELQANMPFTDRLIEELDWNGEGQVKKKIVPGESNIIVFDKVCFSYQNTEKEILQNFNLTIKSGERIAITGKSGSGKTTVLKLMMGFLAPSKGRILFGGVDVKEIDLAAMHSRIGFVMQESMLFNTTIRENLFYGKDGASEKELIDVCKKAYIYDFITGLPEGMNTVIGEEGVKLSGGQRQRIVLARLFLRDVDVFVFDEATSALDQYSENMVYDAIRRIPKNKTVIIVAHRESSISLCDRRLEIVGR